VAGVQAEDLVVVDKGVRAEVLVVRVVVVERLADEVLAGTLAGVPLAGPGRAETRYQAVEVVHPLDVHKVPAAVLVGALDVPRRQAAAGPVLGSYEAGSVFAPVSIPSRSPSQGLVGAHSRRPELPRPHRPRANRPCGRSPPA